MNPPDHLTRDGIALFTRGAIDGARVSARRSLQAFPYLVTTLDGDPLAFCHDLACALNWFLRLEYMGAVEFERESLTLRRKPARQVRDVVVAAEEFEHSRGQLARLGFVKAA